MQVKLTDIGKRYNREWIFRHVNFTFDTDQSYAILGANGSGKSTLLQTIAGSLIPSEGTIQYVKEGKQIQNEQLYKSVSIAAPYLDLPEEFTLKETLNFHQKLQSFKNGLTIRKLIQILYLEDAAQKPIKYFSSGMKQRVKLGLAILSDTPLLFLDEPSTNLDSRGVSWYRELIEEYGKDRLIIVCSNQQEEEYGFCSKSLTVEDYK